MSSRSDEGLHVQARLIVSHPVEERFDASGNELLQIRGTVVDTTMTHPPVVVRFAGQQRAQLARWTDVGKHLSVEGSAEIKHWRDKSGQSRVALLIEAINVFPLSDAVTDNARIGVYATGVDTAHGEPVSIGRKTTRAARVKRLRDELDSA